MAIENTYSVASFVGTGCLGNPHRVCVNPKFRSLDERDLWLDAAGDRIAVLLFTEPSTVPRVEFYQGGHAIFRCGSGTLAAAHVLFRELNLSSRYLETTAGRVALKREGEWIGYGASPLPIRADQTLGVWQSVLNQTVKNCFRIGGDRDYCLLELNNEQAVAEASVDSTKLKAASERALIITAAATRPEYDYVLRYFAPHHGKPEDPATGSANLQVAGFWHERLNRNRLHGRQLSEAGGEFILRIDGDYTWVMGRTRDVRRET
ncbi:MAG: PhzF family phenazine biosynthesis protein [Cellvibrionaceae bacterium]